MNNHYYGWGLPIDISTHGWHIDLLIKVIHVVMLVLFVGWALFLIYSLIRFRARAGQKAEYHTKHFKTPTYLEVAVIVTEVILLAAFSFPIWHRYTQEFPPRDKSLLVRVVAEQFAWNVHYPGKDRIFGKADVKLISSMNPLGLDPADPNGKDDVSTINQLEIPVNTPVIVDLSSKDVIHSFSLPVMRVKQDAIPGQTAPIWFEAKQPGEFEIACAQLCGLGHYRMKGFFTVVTQEKFDQWMAEQLTQKV